MSFQVHGNYCGPGWTGGRFVGEGEAGDYTVVPVDALDALCRDHDYAYEAAESARQAGDEGSYWQQIIAADQALLDGINGLIDDLIRQVQNGDPEATELFDVTTKVQATFIAKQEFWNKPNRNGAPPSWSDARAIDEFLWDKFPLTTDAAKSFSVSPVSSAANTKWRESVTYRPRDPLAIDLDGDGIETVGINGTNPILFDHNADGMKTGTGWVGGDDAWLVLDRDANGSIDSGRELFGVDTQITVGGVTRNATSGFEALSALDANADGVFDASDAEFANVRLWQDANQDGVSQSGELITPAQAGITAIGLTPGGGTVNLGNGNSITGQAVVTRSNGSTTTVDSVSVGGDTNAGNLNLADNPFYREFSDTVPLTEAAQTLPEMGGSGAVRDLREAMSLGTSEADALTAAVQAFAAASARDEQLALLDGLLRAWAATEAVEDKFAIEPAGSETRRFAVWGGSSDPQLESKLQSIVPVLEVFNGATLEDGGINPGTSVVGGQTIHIYSLSTVQANLMVSAYDALRESVYTGLVTQTRLKPYLDTIELEIDESGIHFNTAPLAALLDARKTADERNAVIDLVELARFSGPTLQAVGFDATGTLRTWAYALPAESPVRSDLASLGVFLAAAAAGTGGGDIYVGSDAANTFDAGSGNDLLDGGDGGDTLTGGAGDDTLVGGAGNDTLNGGTGGNTYLFGLGDGQDVIVAGNDASTTKLSTLVFGEGISASDVTATRSGDALLLSLAGTGDSVTVAGFFVGDAPRGIANPLQQIRFADGTVWDLTTIVAKALTGTAAADSLRGTVDADVIDGGAGDDTIEGNQGNDTILFGRGDGHDVINGNAWSPGVNTLRLKADVTSQDVTVSRSGSSLVVTIGDSGDSVTVPLFFYEDNPGNALNPLQQVAFEDGTTWDQNTLILKALSGTDGADNLRGTLGVDNLAGGLGNDTLNGAAGNDAIDGGAGNDTLWGEAGDDSLTGGDGADTLYGGAGNDALDGGAGNDVLEGNEGNDTILFGRGDGQDSLNGNSWSAGFNTLQFKPGVASNEVTVARSGSSLILSIVGTTDTVSVPLFFYEDNPGNSLNPLQQVLFADGTSWGIDKLVALASGGTEGNDTLVGTSGADVLSGAAGNDSISGQDGTDVLYGGVGGDTLNGGNGNDSLIGGDGVDSLYGGAGNDLIDGGAGNDTIDGNEGNDTYLFGRGDAQDVIKGNSWSPGVNTLRFKAGVSPGEVTVQQSGSALVVSISGTTDKVSVPLFFYQDSPSGNGLNPLQQVAFDDGTTWDLNALILKALSGTDGADNLRGTTGVDNLAGGLGNDTLNGAAGNDVIDGGAGNDSLTGAAGDDSLIGGDGVDSLYGGAGNDVLEGGAGNDVLEGNEGNDTILFGRGDGQDTLNGNSWSAGFNTLQFKPGVASNEVTVQQSGTTLVLNIAGTTDKVSVPLFFYQDNPAGNGLNPLQQARFDDGTVWDQNTLILKALGGTDGADNLRGTVGANNLAGGSGNDTLNGAAGNDTISGGEGNDTLIGGSGNDTYLMDRGFGSELLQESDSTAGNTDVVQFMAGIASDQIWLRKVGNDLEVSIIGTADKMTVQNWYSGSAYHVEQFKTSDGKTLLDSQVQNLVSAMAGFAPPAMGQTTLPEDYQASLAPTIASSWGS